MWSTVEVNVCILCANLPLMRPLATKISRSRLANKYRGWRDSRAPKPAREQDSGTAVNDSSTSGALPRKDIKITQLSSLDDTIVTMPGQGEDVEKAQGRIGREMQGAGPNKAFDQPYDGQDPGVQMQDLSHVAHAPTEPNDLTSTQHWNGPPPLQDPQVHVTQLAEPDQEYRGGHT